MGCTLPKLEAEYNRYLNSPKANVESNALDYWMTHSEDYPILSAMTKDYLTIQASRVSSERLFSSRTDLVSPDC